MRTATIAAAAAALMLGACSNPSPDAPAAPADGGGRARAASSSEGNRGGKTGRERAAGEHGTGHSAARVDPRKGGFEIVLGEWAVTPEAEAIRPGPVTFVIHNRGTMAHGFEIELEGDSSGSGSGDLFKAESELLQPGESTRMSVTLDLPGTYKIECLVDGHDDMGMEGPLEVRPDAPLVRSEPKVARERGDGGRVAIADFAFSPPEAHVGAGTKVTWSNDDPTAHTVTAEDGTFDSGTLDAGKSFAVRFDEPGTYRYRCEIHPDMKGSVTVE